MRLTFTLFVSALVACVFPLIAAAHNVQNSRSGSISVKRASYKSSTSQVIAQRQHHVHRDRIDLCVSIDASVLAPVLHILDPLAAKIRLCLCLQDLNIFLDSDVGLLLGSILGGKDSLLAKIKLLITTSPQSQSCTFPTHSHRLCVAKNPCGYECDPPYIKDGKKCICPPPMLECNGVCGNFPHGCSSAVPYKQRRDVGIIDSYASAQALCKHGQTVCGIPGREETKEFECIDTKATLDSCGGCIAQHPFADGPFSAKGIDCGGLPGVATSACSDSRCVITNCRPGWHLDSKQNTCVQIHGAVRRGKGLRMNKAARRRDTMIENVVDSDLVEQLNAYALLVLQLSNTSQTLSAVPTNPRDTTESPASFDYAYYVNTILVATVNALNSPTIAALVSNIDALVNVNALATSAFEACESMGALGLVPLLDDLIAVTDAGLGLQNWCSSHRVGLPSNPLDKAAVPNTSGAPIRIGLDDVLNVLGIASKNNYIDVAGLGPELTGTVNILLNDVGLGPANVRPRSLTQPTTALNAELLRKTKTLVDDVITLKNYEPNLPSPAQPSVLMNAGIPPIDYNLINSILEVVANLLRSNTVASFVGNADTIVRTNSLVKDALESCKCISDLRLEGLVDYLTTVIEAALDIQDWCSHNPVGVPVPYPTNAPTSTPSAPVSNTLDTTAIVDLDLNALLSGLGLGPTAGDDLLGLGSLLDGLLEPINTTLKGGSSNVVDLTLLTQIRILANLTLAILNGSSILPAAPQNSPIGSASPSGVNSDLIVGLVQATLDLLNSGTVGGLLHNLQVLADVNSLVQSSLAGCGCIGQLGLAGLVKDIDDLLAAVLNTQGWCAANPVVTQTDASSLPAPTTTSGHVPIPPEAPASQLLDIVIDLDLGDLVSALTLGLLNGADTMSDLNSLLNTLVGVIVHIQQHSKSLPPALATTSATHPAPSALAPAQPLSSPVTLNQGLVEDLLQAVVALLNSITRGDLLTNVITLLNLGGLLGESMDHCGCISSLGLEALENDVDALLDVLLNLHAWCDYHPTGKSGVGSKSSPASDSIKIDTDPLLTALGLNKLLHVKGNVVGLGLGDVVNPLLHDLGLGGVRRWLLG